MIDYETIKERLLDDIEYALQQASHAGKDLISAEIFKIKQECLDAFIAPKE